MNRNMALITAGSLTSIIGLVVCAALIIPAIMPVQGNTASPIIVNEPVTLPRVEQINAPAVNQQAETGLTNGASETATQTQPLQTQITQLQTQIDQKMGQIQTLQSNRTTLQQSVQAGDNTRQNELTSMINAENQLRLELQELVARLNVAYEELTRQQNLAQQQMINQQKGNHYYEDDDEYGEHEYEDDDDHHEYEDDD